MNRSQRRSTNRSLRPNMNQSLLRSSTNRDRNQHPMPLRRNMLALRGKRSLRNFEVDVEEVDVKGGRFLWMKPKGPPFFGLYRAPRISRFARDDDDRVGYL